MTILGVDPSSHKIGLCALTRGRRGEELVQLTTITIPKKPKLDLPDLCVKVQSAVADWCGVLPDLVAIEEPFVQYARAALPLAWVCGGLSVGFGKTKVITVQHKSWKMALVGRGNADKPATMSMLKGMGFSPADEHQASALGVALYAWNHKEE